jgi:alpha-glucosidase
MTAPWWRDAVVYQVYVRSFADSDGDGVGDLPGITAGLPHIAALGADAVWLTPFYRSPMADHGYDVTDQCDVDPVFGTLKDLDDLLVRAHELGLRVIVDLVPNHSSVEHAWFREALADRGKRDRYLFRDGVGDGPPNNWQSVFRGPAWTQVPDGQWYLHLFDDGQPDFNWRHPEVHAEWERILRFWLDRGVDGFRIDVAHGLYKSADLADNPPSDTVEDPLFRSLTEPNTWDQPEVVEVYRRWREITDSYEDRVMVGEVFLSKVQKVKRFVGKQLLHQSFNFPLLAAPLDAGTWRSLIEESLAAFEGEGSGPTWVLSNHDVVRHATRYGGGEEGVARARAATLTVLGLPGSPYLYQGEELGLEQDDLAPEVRQDPLWLRTEGAEPGRDGCRTPLPWTPDPPGHGFTTGTPWLPLGPQAKERNVESVPETLLFYRKALALRMRLRDELPRAVQWLDLGDDVLGYRRGHLTVVLNTGASEVALPPGEVLAASREVTGVLPPGTAVWLRS